MFGINTFLSVCDGDAQDEKNQVMTTNVWVEQVTLLFSAQH